MADSPLMVSLSANLSDERLAQLTRDLERDLSRAGIQARPVGTPPVPGERGEAATLGAFGLAFVTSGTAKALIECFTAYLSRERTLTIKLTRPDGTRVEVNEHNVGTPTMRAALEAMASARSG